MKLPWFAIGIAAFVMIDAIVVGLVLHRILKLRAALPQGLDLRALREFTKQLEETTEMHVRTNWSGDPSTLPNVLEALIAQLQSMALERGIQLERPLLKQSVAKVIEKRDLVPVEDLRAALKLVA